MYIKNVALSGFGKLNNYSIEFSNNKINIVLGENESGKSTLCDAIEAIIYGLRSKFETELKRSWDYSGDFCGVLEIDLNGAVHKFERDFENDHMVLTRITEGGDEKLFDGDANPRGRTEQPKAYRKLLEDIGFPPETIFRSAIYVGQLDLEVNIDDDLRQQISGAGKADYLRSLSVLEKQYYSLTRQNLPGDNPKRVDKKLEMMISRRESLEQELQDARISSTVAAETKLRKEELDQKHEQLKKRKNRIEVRKNELDDYLNLQKERTSLTQLIMLEREKRDATTKLINDVNELKSEIDDKFAFYKDLTKESLSELESYVQSDAENTLVEITNIQAQEKELRLELANPNYDGFSDLPEHTSDILQNLANNKNKIVSLTNQIENLKVKKNTPRWLSLVILIVPSIIGVLLGFIGIFVGKYDVSNSISIFLFLLGVLCVVVAAFFFVVLNNRGQKEKENRIEHKVQLEEKQGNYTELISRIKPLLQSEDENEINFKSLAEKWDQYKEKKVLLENLIEKRNILAKREIFKIRSNPELKPILDKIPSKTIQRELKNFHATKTKLETNLENLEKRINEQDTSEKINKLEERLNEVIILLNQLEKKNPSISTFREHPQEGYSLQSDLISEFDDITTDMENMNQEIRSLDIKLGQITISNLWHPQLIEEELLDLDEEIKRLNTRIIALQIAIEILKDAIDEYEDSHISRLSKLTSSSFSSLTHGNYENVDVLPGEDPHIFTGNKRSVQLGQLSTGAKDQLFFAIRLAISEILSNEISLPIILDDPFVNFDQGRLDIAHNTLRNLLDSKQIILLSHDPKYGNWGYQIEIGAKK